MKFGVINILLPIITFQEEANVGISQIAIEVLTNNKYNSNHYYNNGTLKTCNYVGFRK